MTTQKRIEYLEHMKSSIAAEFDDLVHWKNEILVHHLNELELIHEKKLSDVEQWYQNELKSAETVAEGERYQNDSDFSEKQATISTRIGDFIAFKQKVLNEKFPEAAKYFREKGYNSPIAFSYREDPPQFTPQVAIDTSDEPLFTPEEIKKDIDIFQETSPKYLQRNRILNGLQNGDHAIMTVKNMPPLRGTIGKLFDEYFEFKMLNNKILSITYQAIARGQASIEPEIQT